MIHRTILSIALSFGMMSAPAAAQSELTPAQQKLLEAAREVIANARNCALITIDSTGRPHARVMDPFAPDTNMVIRLGTNAFSRKVREIQRDDRVALFYFDRENAAYVSLYGRAQVSDDPAILQRWWKKAWEAFYPEKEKTYRVIIVRPERLEIVSEKHGIIGDEVTWAVPAVEFKTTRGSQHPPE